MTLALPIKTILRLKALVTLSILKSTGAVLLSERGACVNMKKKEGGDTA